MSGRLHSSRSQQTSSVPITSPVFLSRIASRDLDRRDFAGEEAFLLGARGALLADQRILVLRLRLIL